MLHSFLSHIDTIGTYLFVVWLLMLIVGTVYQAILRVKRDLAGTPTGVPAAAPTIEDTLKADVNALDTYVLNTLHALEADGKIAIGTMQRYIDKFCGGAKVETVPAIPAVETVEKAA